MKTLAYHSEDKKKQSSKKRFYHPCHEGVTTRSVRKRKAIKLPEGIPFPDRNLRALEALLEEDKHSMKQALRGTRAAGVRKNWCSCTLLHIAVRYDLNEMVKVLLEMADPNAVNRFGQTPAHLAAIRGNTNILRMMIAHEKFNPTKTDVWSNTFIDNLSAPLFTAVLWSNEKEIEELLELGANPDGHAGMLVEGITARELQVKTPRELAIALKKETIIQKFSKIKLSKRVLKNVDNNQVLGQEVVKSETCLKGIVFIFNYHSFKGHPDLSNSTSRAEADHLAEVFSDLGYNGDIHTSLTAEETLEALRNIRSMELVGDAEAAIFYFSSYVASEDSGPEDSFLTSNMESLSVKSIISIFRESKCPFYLKKKPKIFIFDLLRLPKGKLNGSKGLKRCLKGAEDDDITPYAMRNRGGPQQTVCLYSILDTDLDLDSLSNGSAFNKSVCNILSKKGQRIGVNKLFLMAQKEMKEKRIASQSYMETYGFNRDIYFNS